MIYLCFMWNQRESLRDGVLTRDFDAWDLFSALTSNLGLTVVAGETAQIAYRANFDIQMLKMVSKLVALKYPNSQVVKVLHMEDPGEDPNNEHNLFGRDNDGLIMLDLCYGERIKDKKD